jgi:hypothetical protein
MQRRIEYLGDFPDRIGQPAHVVFLVDGREIPYDGLLEKPDFEEIPGIYFLNRSRNGLAQPGELMPIDDNAMVYTDESREELVGVVEVTMPETDPLTRIS